MSSVFYRALFRGHTRVSTQGEQGWEREGDSAKKGERESRRGGSEREREIDGGRSGEDSTWDEERQEGGAGELVGGQGVENVWWRVREKISGPPFN